MTTVSTGDSFSGIPDAQRPPVQPGLRARLLSASIWVIGARVFGITSTVLVNMVLARQLVPEAFGDFVVVCSVTSAVSLVSIFGLNSGVVRFVAEQLAHGKPQGARHVLRLCFRLASISTVVTAVVVLVSISVSGGHFLNLANPVPIAVLSASIVAIQAFSNLNAAALRGLGEMRYSSMVGGQAAAVGPLASTLFLVFVLMLVLVTPMTLIYALSTYLTAFAVALLVGNAWYGRTIRQVLGSPDSNSLADTDHPMDARTILLACWPMLLVQVLSIVSKQGGLWVAGATANPQDIALYAGANRAIQLVVMPLGLINLSVMALIPQLKTQGRLQELERALRVSAGWAAIPSFVALVAFVLVPATILDRFLGPNYREAAGLLSILSFGQFALVWVGSSELTLVLSGHARVAAAINGIAACSIMIGGPIVARSYGTTGLAIVSASVIAGMCLAQWVWARKLVHVWTHAVLFPWRTAKQL